MNDILFGASFFVARLTCTNWVGWQPGSLNKREFLKFFHHVTNKIYRLGMEKAKIVVIGAGPAGIATAVEMQETGLPPPVVLEKASHLCDTIVRFYRAGKRVDAVYQNIQEIPQGRLSFTTQSKEDFLVQMDNFVKQYRLDIRYGHECHKVLIHDDTFHIYTSSGLKIEANVVVIAIGIFGKPVKPSYQIPAEIRKKILFSLPQDSLADQDILVVGGGDSAAEAACFLCQNNNVTLSYRKANFFRVNETNMCTLDGYCCAGKINTKMSSDIVGLEPANNRIKVLFINDEPQCFDFLFYFLGGSTPQTFLENIGVEFRGRKPLADEYGETNISRLFLAGDLALEKGSIMGAFNSACRTRDGILKRYRNLIAS